MSINEKELPWGMMGAEPAEPARKSPPRRRGGERFKHFLPGHAGTLAKSSARIENVIWDIEDKIDELHDVPEEFIEQKVRFLSLVDKLSGMADRIK